MAENSKSQKFVFPQGDVVLKAAGVKTLTRLTNEGVAVSNRVLNRDVVFEVGRSFRVKVDQFTVVIRNKAGVETEIARFVPAGAKAYSVVYTNADGKKVTETVDRSECKRPGDKGSIDFGPDMLKVLRPILKAQNLIDSESSETKQTRAENQELKSKLDALEAELARLKAAK